MKQLGGKPWIWANILKTDGRGVIATADADGNVDVAVYSRPHFIDENTIVYIMTTAWLIEISSQTPMRIYLHGIRREIRGKRLYLTKIKEETDPEAINKIRWRKNICVPEDEKNECRFLVYFKIDKVLELFGEKE